MTLDIALGIFSAIFVSKFFSVSLDNQLVLVGVIFALLPDLDFILELIRKNIFNISYTHRDMFHLPLIYIPLGSVIIYQFDKSLSLLFLLTSFFHFLHDSIGIGWGVEWLFPFSRKHFAFFYLYSLPERRIPRRLVYIWTHQDLEEWGSKYGDINWFKHVYLQLHPYALFEHSIFVLSIIILAVYKFSS